jgi:hypothetical protein
MPQFEIYCLKTVVEPLPGQGYGSRMDTVAMILAPLAIVVVSMLSARRGQRQLAALPSEQLHVMRQAGSVAFWFGQGAALFLVLYGLWTSGYPLILLWCSFAAVFCVVGIWMRYMTRRPHDAQGT